MKIFSIFSDTQLQLYACICTLGALLGFACLVILADQTNNFYSARDMVIYALHGSTSSLLVWFAYSEFWVGWNQPNSFKTDLVAGFFVVVAPMHLLQFPPVIL